VVSGQERTGFSVPSVGSARSQLFMPGLHHAHTLQHPKKKLLDAHPRESVLNNLITGIVEIVLLNTIKLQ